MNAHIPATMRGDKPNLSGESTACQLRPFEKIEEFILGKQ